MKLGQLVNGYEIVTRPSNADAGKCLWAFARKDGKDYFVKEYLEPKRPRPDSMGSVADKQRRYAECERFERRQRTLSRMLRADHPHAGNLVLTKDFFAEGTRYYKVTDRISVAEVHPHRLDPARQDVLVRTLAESLMLLHECNVVHGDLKPENVLVHQPGGSDLYIAKVIDFDDAYAVGDPPPRDVVVGNPLYGAPEWLRYIRRDRQVGGAQLTPAVDMFAFSLLVHRYLCGALPGFDPRHESPAAAVLDGDQLSWHPRLDPRWAALLPALTDADPASRPGIGEVIARFDAGRARPAPAPARSRVRINLTGRRPAEGIR